MPVTQREMEHWWGLTEVVMIRLPLEEWASETDRKEIEAIGSQNPLPDGWPELQSAVIRRSAGFQEWLRRLAQRQWKPRDGVEERAMSRLSTIDFALPWCARVRWGAGNVKTVDIFIHATGDAGHVEWETIGVPTPS